MSEYQNVINNENAAFVDNHSFFYFFNALTLALSLYLSQSFAEIPFVSA